MVILRRLEDNKVLEIFSDKIGFIVEYDTEIETNFIVSDYSEIYNNGDRVTKLKHYIVNKYEDSLQLKESLECDDCNLSKCRITDSSYLIENGYTSYIYNLNEKSKRFEFIYKDKKLKDYFSDSTLLVSERRMPFECSYMDDILTYGINPETFEITTPIWSEMQQRLINIYTFEQAQKIKDKYLEKGLILRFKNLGDLTICFEIDEHLQKIEDALYERLQGVYLDSKYFGYEINENFVKQFVKK